jgi:ABC-2 type transport system permease protein
VEIKLISLIKNELIKIFKKKTIYVLFGVILGAIIATTLATALINKIYYINENSNGYEEYVSDEYRNSLINELNSLDVNSESDKSSYISARSDLDFSDLLKKYGIDSWQATIINDRMQALIYELNEVKYSNDVDETYVKEIEEEYNKYITKLNNNDWQYFVKEDLEQNNNQKKEIEQNIKNTVNKEELKNFNKQLYYINVEIEALNIRINDNISYKSDYLNTALEDYVNAKNNIYGYNASQATYQEQLDYDNYIAIMEKSKYILDSKQDLNSSNNARSCILGTYDQYSTFIFIAIIVIAATIVSEEFSKGTIKLLLVKPYSRSKILLSKLITLCLILIVIVLFLLLSNTLVSGIIYSFDSLEIPVVEYNFNTNSLDVMNVFEYMIIETLYKLPEYLFILILAFATSTISTNSGVAVAVALIIELFSSLINMAAIDRNVEIMKYFITLNLDFSQYMFGAKPEFRYINFTHSLIVYIVYVLLILIPTFIVFKKKNIRNI